MRLRPAQRRLARTMQDRTDTRQGIRFRRGQVTAFTTAGGTTTDGAGRVTASIDGDTQYMAAWVQPYTAGSPPANGDQVLVLLIDNSPTLVGKLVGFPVI